jgi:hypothetical protein
MGPMTGITAIVRVVEFADDLARSREAAPNTGATPPLARLDVTEDNTSGISAQGAAKV